MTIKSIWLRRIHKWVGLAIGLQFVLWTISGAIMAVAVFALGYPAFSSWRARRRCARADAQGVPGHA